MEIINLLFNNNTILGIISHYVNNLDIIKYYGNYYSTSNIIFHNNKWQCLDSIIDKLQLSKYNGIMYNLITQNGTFQTHDFIFRDYLELHSVDIYNNVRRLTLSILNSKQ